MYHTAGFATRELAKVKFSRGGVAGEAVREPEDLSDRSDLTDQNSGRGRNGPDTPVSPNFHGRIGNYQNPAIGEQFSGPMVGSTSEIKS